jgi:rfaE bifunctional protein kinase chain/domain
MEENKLKKILSKLKNISVIVIGDFFLDKYLEIDRSRKEMSVETGLEAYQVVGKTMSPGAAGTVTNNLRSLGVGQVIAMGFIGDDGEGYDLEKGLKKSGVETKYMIKTKKRVTPTYIKPVISEDSGLREINRLDIKNFTPTPGDLEDKIIEKLLHLSGKVEGIIALDQLSENNCGVITEKVREALSNLMQNNEKLIVYADSRGNIGLFNNVIIKCNHYEAVKTIFPDIKTEPDEKTIERAGYELTRRTGKPVFITCGKHGQWVFSNTRLEKIPAIPVKDPFDICGAGDANTSGIISALCCGSSLSEAALLGNIISSITIQQLNTTGIVTPSQVLKRYREALS